MDMYKDYHQVRVNERDVHKTAFRTHYGLFEYCLTSTLWTTLWTVQRPS
jgi:hypothetical protein